MDPNSRLLMMGAGGDARVSLGTISWTSNYISTAAISGVNFVAGETSTTSSSSAYTTAFPTVTTTGWHLQWRQIEGYSQYINFVGVSNTNSVNMSYGDTRTTTWYWSGGIFGLGSGSGPGVLRGDYVHTLAVRLESGSPRIYFKNGQTGTVAGPFDCPSGTLYFITQNQGGYKIGDITIQNSGTVYQGGGGLW
jgi:hypothetical protein